MTSPSTSPSEGEIVESDSEKATKSLPSAKDTFVDRTSRKRSPASRSPSPYRVPRRYDSESRSRSPYRADRKGKRTREDDHYLTQHERKSLQNSKSFRSDRRDDRRAGGRRSYKDVDRDQGSSADLRYEDQASFSSREKRPRTVSRSPPRFNDKRQAPRRTEENGAPHQTQRGDGTRNYKIQSVGDRLADPPGGSSLKSNAESRKSQAEKSVSFKLGTKVEATTADKYVPPLVAVPVQVILISKRLWLIPSHLTKQRLSSSVASDGRLSWLSIRAKAVRSLYKL